MSVSLKNISIKLNIQFKQQSPGPNVLIYTKYGLLENIQDYQVVQWAALLIITWIKTSLDEALQWKSDCMRDVQLRVMTKVTF